jgi:hypothetical protein
MVAAQRPEVSFEAVGAPALGGDLGRQRLQPALGLGGTLPEFAALAGQRRDLGGKIVAAQRCDGKLLALGRQFRGELLVADALGGNLGFDALQVVAAPLHLGNAFLPFGLQGLQAGVEAFGALALRGEFLAFAGKFAGEPVARRGEACFRLGEFPDPVIEIADLRIAGDQLQPQFGGLLAARLKLALGRVQLGGPGADLAVAVLDIGAGGGQRRLVLGDRRGEAGDALLQLRNLGGQFVAGAGELVDLFLPAGQVGRLGDQLLVELGLGDLKPPRRDGEVGAQAILVGVDLSTGEGDAGLDAGPREPCRPPPDHRRDHEHQQAGGKQAKCEIHCRLNQDRSPSRPTHPDASRPGSWRRHITAN